MKYFLFFSSISLMIGTPQHLYALHSFVDCFATHNVAGHVHDYVWKRKTFHPEHLSLFLEHHAIASRRVANNLATTVSANHALHGGLASSPLWLFETHVRNSQRYLQAARRTGRLEAVRTIKNQLAILGHAKELALQGRQPGYLWTHGVYPRGA